LNTWFNNASTKIKRGPKHVTIWKLDAILNRIVALFPPDNLPWQQLMGIAGAIFLIFVPCRMEALICIDPTEVSIDEEDGSVTSVTKEKTDEGGSRSTLCIRRRPERPLSPRYYFDLLSNRSKRLGCPTALFVSDAGKPYTRSDSIAKSMGRLMQESGINIVKYKPYSIRHAMINELINSGMDEKTSERIHWPLVQLPHSVQIVLPS
jgi:integrase